MGETTAIAWTDHTFNPWVGCDARVVVGVAVAALALSAAWWMGSLRSADDSAPPCVDAITLDDPTGDCP